MNKIISISIHRRVGNSYPAQYVPETVNVELIVDEGKLAHRLGKRAAGSKSGKAVLAGGLITVKVVK